jgi:hypothetical protein
VKVLTINEIKIEQTLHGYSNGHHLLATSLNSISDKSSKLMSILSDLSGPEIISGFEEYFTGYPLQSEGMYAFSKTWYASEMKRPGCVWTHTLLINFEYLNCDLNLFSLLNYFLRPNGENLHLDKYSNQISIQQKNDFVLPKIISKAKVELLTWSLMSSERPIIVPSYSSADYQVELFTIIQSQLSLWGHFLTFSTGSLANRSIDKKTFDLQVIPPNIVKNICRNNTSSLVLDTIKNSNEYPQWVSTLSSEMMVPSNSNFQQFVDYFNSDILSNRELLGKMAMLYSITEICNNSGTLSAYFKNVRKLFSDDVSDMILYKTIIGIFHRNNLHWFMYKSVSSIFEQISTLEDFEINLSQDIVKAIKTSIEKMWDSEINIIKVIFSSLITSNINTIGELLITSIALKVSSITLYSFTNMDLKACSVLVSANNEIALCEDLWKQSRNFQLEILSYINKSIMDDLTAKKIINMIISSTNEVLYKQIYSKFGNSAVSAILSWYYEVSKNQSVNKEWLSISRLNETECMKWLITIRQCDNYNMIYDLVLVLNPYSKDVLQFGKEPWESLFSRVDLFKCESNTILSLSLFLLPILILTNRKFSDKIASFIFITINEKLANQKLDYDSWEKIDKILPEVSWFRAWDKCKRLRMAFLQRGYQIT